MRRDSIGRIGRPPHLHRIDVAEIGPSSYVVAVGGDIDDDGANDVKDALYPLAGHAGARVVVDLGTVPIVGAALLAILTGGAHLLVAAGGELVLVTRDPRARRLFEETGLANVAHVESSLAGAVIHGDAAV